MKCVEHMLLFHTFQNLLEVRDEIISGLCRRPGCLLFRVVILEFACIRYKDNRLGCHAAALLIGARNNEVANIAVPSVAIFSREANGN